MARSAEPVASVRSVSTPDGGDRAGDTDAGLASLHRQPGYGRRLRPTRAHLALVALLVIAAWFVVGFARTITQLNAATDRRAVVATETSILAARLAAGQREVELTQTDAFQALQARAFGIGASTEIAFSLSPGAPSPAEVAQLGSRPQHTRAPSPLDAWLRLLFGG